jgi:hypothetical protein
MSHDTFILADGSYKWIKPSVLKGLFSGRMV